MKNIILLNILFFAISLGTSAQSDEVLVPYNSDTMSKGLKININVGNIEIKGTDRKDILVKYTFKAPPKTDKEQINSDGLTRISIGKSNINIQAVDDMLQISDSDFPNELELYIEVPVNININSYKGGPGTLNITNIKGNLNLENNSGSIIATEINGLVNASTNEGVIKIEFNSLTSNYDMMLTNIMGDIEVNLPKASDISFHLKTNRGELLTNLDLQMQESKSKEPKKSNSSEGFSYTNDAWTDATLNAGGPSMTISSITGNIIIKGK